MARTVTLDLSATRALLQESLDTIDKLDGLKLEVDFDRGRSRQNSPAAAQVSRELLRLGDLTRAAAGEFGVTYWRFKGFPDPRDDRDVI